MANPLTQTYSYTSESEQNILKKSRDDKYDVLAVMLLGEDGNTARRIKVDSSGSLVNSESLLPTDNNNPSYVISNDDSEQASTKTITKTIGSTSYTKTLGLNANGDVITISSWVILT